jgi:3-oxoadipate enol-lactonase
MQINGSTPRELAVEVNGSGPPVLMVHGLGGTSNFYQVQTEALADRFQVIRVDSAGAGRSPLADNISISSHADDLVAVLDQLGADAPAVVGHSMGTLVVRDLAARYPERVSRLALLGAVAEPTDAVRKAQRDRATTLRREGTAAIAPGIIANALADMILVDGNPLDDISILQDHGRLHYIMKDGRFHKQPGDEPAPPPDQDELIASSAQATVEHRP